MRVLVCGGRDFRDALLLGSWLGGLMNRSGGIACIIEGGAEGADRMARYFGEWKGLTVHTYSADWILHGKAAGPLRNRRMLQEGKPDLVLAFPGGRGTADMVRQARDAGVRVVEVAAGDLTGASWREN